VAVKFCMTDGQQLKVQIWDTAGQETYRSVTRGYYKGTQGALVIFDNSKLETLKNVGSWIKDLKDHSSGAEIVLVGNKTDVVKDPATYTAEANSVAAQHGVEVFHTSAKTGDNVSVMFESTIEMLYDKVRDGSLAPHSPALATVDLTAKPPAKKGCC